MIHYTPLSQYDVYPINTADYGDVQYIPYNGKVICAEKLQDGNYQIQQLVSTDPQDFLRSEFSPGRIL